MNAYKAFCFHTNERSWFLVLEAIVSDVKKREAFLQGFVLNRGCYPFPLVFQEDIPEEKLMETALEDGSNYVKNIENLGGEKTEIPLKNLISHSDFLRFIKENCKSTKLSEDINKILEQIALA